VVQTICAIGHILYRPYVLEAILATGHMFYRPYLVQAICGTFNVVQSLRAQAVCV